MIRRDIDRKARLVIAEALPVSLNRVTEHADLRSDLAATGAGLVRLGQKLTAVFGVRLSDEELAFAATVGTLCDFIETKLENRRVA